MYRTMLGAMLVLMLVVVVGSAYAGEPPPPPKGICHNIGGPRELGANCDATGCTVDLEGGGTLVVRPGQFLGIIISFNQLSAGALNAHINHGDGPVLRTFDPPLHLASTGQNHEASNVECLGTRLIEQPEEPGN